VIARVLSTKAASRQDDARTRFPKDDWRALTLGRKMANTIHRVDKLKKIVPAGMTLPKCPCASPCPIPHVTRLCRHARPEHVRRTLPPVTPPLDAGLLAELKSIAGTASRSGVGLISCTAAII